MDNQVRVFRKNPIAWWDKNVIRYLRSKYGRDKKAFLMLRSVYLALCEIESDFNDKPINFFAKTVGTYAGLSREAAGKYINLLVKEGLIKKTQIKDQRTKSFSSGTVVEILGLENTDLKAKKPLSAYPDIGVSRHRDTRATNKKLSIDKKIINNVNEDLKIFDNKERNTPTSLKDIFAHYNLKRVSKSNQSNPNAENDYLVKELAEKLNDTHSLGCYRKIIEKIPHDVVFEVLANVKDTAMTGKIRRSKGALFVEIIKRYAQERGISLGFKQGDNRENNNNRPRTTYDTTTKR